VYLSRDWVLAIYVVETCLRQKKRERGGDIFHEGKRNLCRIIEENVGYAYERKQKLLGQRNDFFMGLPSRFSKLEFAILAQGRGQLSQGFRKVPRISSD